MSQDLARYDRGLPMAQPSRAPRRGSPAKAVYEETRLAGLKVDATYALAGHIMEGAVVLDQHRQRLAQGDQTLNMILTEVEVTAVRQVQKIQLGLFAKFGL